ncbi:hypothetical protein G6F22_021740 [Rhizopus arrhizus]|nr:hypothetical protein G6F22_021740 [Rhizopus arrhizus]
MQFAQPEDRSCAPGSRPRSGLGWWGVPLRVMLLDQRAVLSQRVACADLQGAFRGIVLVLVGDLALQDRLHGQGRQQRRELGQVRAALMGRDPLGD